MDVLLNEEFGLAGMGDNFVAFGEKDALALTTGYWFSNIKCLIVSLCSTSL